MRTRYSRTEISAINNLYMASAGRGKNLCQDCKVAIPSEEIFSYVLSRAKSGNEMAAVQIDEWCRFCRLDNSKDKIVLNRIKKAADEIFK